MRPLGLILLILGLIAGVGYPIYGRAFSGSVVQTTEILKGQVTDAGPVRISGGRTWLTREVKVELEPADSPARIVSRFTHAPARTRATNRYAATLTGPAGDAVWSGGFDHTVSDDTEVNNGTRQVGRAGSTTSDQTLHTFDVPAAGTYTLAIEPGEAEFTERTASITFRRNVLLLRPAVWIGGLGAAVLGLVLLIAGRRRNKAAVAGDGRTPRPEFPARIPRTEPKGE